MFNLLNNGHSLERKNLHGKSILQAQCKPIRAADLDTVITDLLGQGAHLMLVLLKAGATPLRTMRQYGSAVAVDIRHGCGGSLVPCATQESLLKRDF